MEFTSLPGAFSFIQTHGYLMMFLGMIVEGPTVTTAAAFAASLGLLNIYLVLLISFTGDLVGDLIYFYMGRWKGRKAIEASRYKFGISKKKIKSLEKRLHKYFLPTLFVIKITPMLAPPGLMLIGASQVSFKKFLVSTLLLIIPASIGYTILGFYFGIAASSLFKYFNIAKELMLVFIFIAGIVAYFVEKRIFKKLSRKSKRLDADKIINKL